MLQSKAGFRFVMTRTLSAHLEDFKQIVRIPIRTTPTKLTVCIYIVGQNEDAARKSSVKLLNTTIQTARAKQPVRPIIRHICTKKQLEQCPFGVSPTQTLTRAATRCPRQDLWLRISYQRDQHHRSVSQLVCHVRSTKCSDKLPKASVCSPSITDPHNLRLLSMGPVRVHGHWTSV